MKIPRNLSGPDLVKRLGKLGYETTRQTGSHIRLTKAGDPTHHVTIPSHNALRTGTLSSILTGVANHMGIPKDELIAMLFD